MARRMLERLRLPNVDELLPEPPKPQNMNPAAENVAAMHGQPILALPKQNHLAHIWAHVEFCVNPIFANQILGAQLMGLMVRHIGEHIGFYYADLMSQYSQFENRVANTPTKQLEDMLARANTQALSKLQLDLAPIMPKVQQIQQMAQQFAPQPPMDPAVKATYDVGMAEVNRKSSLDKQQIQLQQQERLQLFPQIEAAKRQVELAKNLRDNIQKHVTELAKNQGDNQTNQWVAAMNAGNEQLMAMVQSKLDQEEAQLGRDHDFNMQAFATQAGTGPDGTDGNSFSQTGQGAAPQDQQDDPRMAQLLQTMQSLHQHMTAPKRVVYDPQGRAVGVHSVVPPQLDALQPPAANAPEGKANPQLDAVLKAAQALHHHIASPKRVVRGPNGQVVGLEPVVPPGDSNDGSIQ
jgi:hypothetical protein